jgi:hypothetical protein
MEDTWKDMLKDSSWVTIAWEWLQSLLGRTVDFILWVTMIFACYQLIPGAPMPAQGVSVFMFVMQFIALDIGGMSLNQIGQRHRLGTWSYTRVVAYACISVTLLTMIFAGIQHAMTVDPEMTKCVEVTLVIARSILTVLYGQAVRAIKVVEQTEDDRVATLEEEVSNLRSQLDAAQGLASELRSRLQERERAYSSLVSEREVLTLQMSLKQQELAGLRDLASGGQDWAQQHLTKLQERLDAEQDTTHQLRLQLQTLELQKSEMTASLRTAKRQIEDLQRELQTAKLQAEKLQKMAENQTAKPSTRSAKLPANVTAIEDAKQRISHAEILAYIAQHPDLKRAEVAANLRISERKVYDAVAWGREQEGEKVVSG